MRKYFDIEERRQLDLTQITWDVNMTWQQLKLVNDDFDSPIPTDKIKFAVEQEFTDANDYNSNLILIQSAVNTFFDTTSANIDEIEQQIRDLQIRSLVFKGEVTTASELPPAAENELGDCWRVDDAHHVVCWTGDTTMWQVVFEDGQQGPPGQDGTDGTNITAVEVTVTDEVNAVLNETLSNGSEINTPPFLLPRGPQGNPGTNGTNGTNITAARVDVTNEVDAVLVETLSDSTEISTPTFALPRGPKGEQGNPGGKGDPGSPGTNGTNITAARVDVTNETDAVLVETLSDSSEISTPTFTLPRGVQGPPGAKGDPGPAGEPTQEQVNTAIANTPRKQLSTTDFLINATSISINWQNGPYVTASSLGAVLTIFNGNYQLKPDATIFGANKNLDVWVKSIVTKSDVGLGNADNTSDANKPVSTAQQTAIDNAVTTAEAYSDSKWVLSSTAPITLTLATGISSVKVGGITINSTTSSISGLVTGSIVAATSVTNKDYVDTRAPFVGTPTTLLQEDQEDVFAVGNFVFQDIHPLSMNNQKISDIADPTDVKDVVNQGFMQTYVTSSVGSKQDTLVSGTNIKKVANQDLLGSGNVALSKTDVGLNNVDNTSDAAKPISTATQAALDLKADKTYVDSALANKQDTLNSGTNIKTIEGQSLLGTGNIDLTKADVGLGNVDNTSDASKPISTATQSALDAKQATLVNQTNIKSVAGQNLLGSGNVALSKTDVGLGNVDNTSDANKPVSTAQQTALNLKANQTSLDTTNANVTALQTQLNNLTIVQNFWTTNHQISVLLLGVATVIIKGKCSFKKGNNIYNLGSTNSTLINSQDFQVSQFGTTWRVYLSTAAANTTGTNLTATYTNGTKTLQSVDAISMSFPNTSTLLLTFRDNTTTPATISFDISALA